MLVHLPFILPLSTLVSHLRDLSIYKKKKGIYRRHPIFINLKSNTMKNTVQIYDFFMLYSIKSV